MPDSRRRIVSNIRKQKQLGTLHKVKGSTIPRLRTYSYWLFRNRHEKGHSRWDRRYIQKGTKEHIDAVEEHENILREKGWKGRMTRYKKRRKDLRDAPV